jgi:deferrochelatase/peroxidase EfeB
MKQPTSGAGEHESGGKRGLTRRDAIAGAALLGAGAALDHVLGEGLADSDGASPPASAGTVPFYGSHQSGVGTPVQEFLHFASFDVTSTSRKDLAELLRSWTVAAAQLTAGREYGPARQPQSRPPADTGEALELPPSQLTLTFGFGPGLFAGSAGDRFGLAHRRPAALAPLPPFPNEDLDPGRSGGDLCVQACANDAQVAFHAIHILSRIAEGVAVLRWTQAGFGRTSSTSRSQTTARNLMGFKDGTNNIDGGDARTMNAQVWVNAGDGPAWMTGGTYLVARRIQMVFEAWDSTSLEAQQQAIGRYKLSGAPLGKRREHDPVDLHAMADGRPVIAANAHIRLASPSSNHGQRILRRGYSYAEATIFGAGVIEGGLFFISFQRDPRQFIEIQRLLSAGDALNRHILHTASAIFACPPGASAPGRFIGEGLLA